MKQAKITEAEVMDLLRSIASGRVKLTSARQPEDIYAGDVEYAASNGWRVVVFNDCNEWDYLDSVTDPNDRSLDFDDLFDMPKVRDYSPTAKVAWLRYGIPGYLKSSGRRGPWKGWTGHPKFKSPGADGGKG